MTTDHWSPLLDIPPFPAERYAITAARLGAILHTRNDIAIVQAEAVVALEAAATSIIRPGMKAINIVTSPYGSWFGNWMRLSGGEVIDVTASPARAIELDAVAETIETHPDATVLSLVHAESASGIGNPLAEIIHLARKRGLLTIVDAVASIGGHHLDVDTLGIDIAVIGPQKALAGPAGLSALSISPAAWDLIGRPGGPRNSILSLSDLKPWIDGGYGAPAGTAVPLEWHALHAALDRLEREGLDGVIARHQLAACATRAGLTAMGVSCWTDDRTNSNLVTTTELPPDIPVEVLLAEAIRLGQPLAAGVGPGAERLIRFTHTGQQARFDTVMALISTYGRSLEGLGHDVDIGSACSAVLDCYAA
ncbi:aminotransferase class V-fold PLP-dependent enzyme [Rhizobiales bacterium RZME27]|jgi:aspartate aminotransferase-like enzyme|uniref:Aminotransferase class V-fold PLP-dependent enzyme n=1 Tax=Endobacterium cereale TaxID=2663029 RepID=A0A6A8A7K9_9HYPH|nr:aminotransferase class V-fold PLP-dependent enzyme [Endobacterium cereale]MEB2843314.1 aminotransferase class V-fold PLP-dependent enzyme [Endobacterium cereale]MQY47272.1 aminotransferase class V-fold PLP-dependent enzyme [Endobacterium cereale]